jgi:hypothetical protein
VFANTGVKRRAERHRMFYGNQTLPPVRSNNGTRRVRLNDRLYCLRMDARDNALSRIQGKGEVMY